MLGAIAGDVIGSVYERSNIKSTQFPLFSAGCCCTDDSVLTVATADVLLGTAANYRDAYQDYFHRYPNAGYGGSFVALGESAARRAVQQLGQRLRHADQSRRLGARHAR